MGGVTRGILARKPRRFCGRSSRLPLAGSAVYCWDLVARSRRARSARSDAQQPELPLAAAPSSRSGSVLESGQAARLAIARRAKPGAPRNHVRLVVTLELRTALAERLSEKAIRSGEPRSRGDRHARSGSEAMTSPRRSCRSSLAANQRTMLECHCQRPSGARAVPRLPQGLRSGLPPSLLLAGLTIPVSCWGG
jgi:hypothetical protein